MEASVGFPPKKILEAEAILEGRDDKDVRPTREGEFDVMWWAKNNNQLSDGLVLVIKATEKWMDRQPLRAKMEGRRKPTGGEVRERMNGGAEA